MKFSTCGSHLCMSSTGENGESLNEHRPAILPCHSSVTSETHAYGSHRTSACVCSTSSHGQRGRPSMTDLHSRLKELYSESSGPAFPSRQSSRTGYPLGWGDHDNRVCAPAHSPSEDPLQGGVKEQNGGPPRRRNSNL